MRLGPEGILVETRAEAAAVGEALLAIDPNDATASFYLNPSPRKVFPIPTGPSVARDTQQGLQRIASGEVDASRVTRDKAITFLVQIGVAEF